MSDPNNNRNNESELDVLNNNNNNYNSNNHNNEYNNNNNNIHSDDINKNRLRNIIRNRNKKKLKLNIPFYFQGSLIKYNQKRRNKYYGSSDDDSDDEDSFDEYQDDIEQHHHQHHHPHHHHHNHNECEADDESKVDNSNYSGRSSSKTEIPFNSSSRDLGSGSSGRTNNSNNNKRGTTTPTTTGTPSSSNITTSPSPSPSPSPSEKPKEKLSRLEGIIRLLKLKKKKKLIHTLGLEELYNIGLYKAAATELMGTAIFMFMSIAIFVTSVNLFSFPPMPNYRIPAASAVLHVPLLFFLILTCAPVSGGHLNPSITFATFLAGYTSFIRMIFYVVSQIVGGIIGAAILRGILPFEVMKITNLGMCVFGDEITYGAALGLEFMFSLFNLYIVFGTALDPRQERALSPTSGAMLVSVALGFSIFTSSGISPSYIFGFNIARCLCPAIVIGIYKYIWPYLVGPIIACIVLGVYIHLVPPFKPTFLTSKTIIVNTTSASINNTPTSNITDTSKYSLERFENVKNKRRKRKNYN